MRSRSEVRRLVVAAGAALCALAVSPAMAQRAGENAVTSSSDAFGTSSGSESSGIYNENDTRGLNPLKAGNARLDGVYFDPVATVPGRLRQYYGIRVGIAANDYPFAAPTGIVDNHLRSAGNKFVASINLMSLQYGGDLEEFDVQVPIVRDHFTVAAGIGHTLTNTTDGARSPSLSIGVRPVLRFGATEISPLYSWVSQYHLAARPLFVTTGAIIPPNLKPLHYLGQDWSHGHNTMDNVGVIVKSPLTSRLSLRGGLFRSRLTRQSNFTEVIAFSAPGTLANHRVISDPEITNRSVSGEVQLAWRLSDEGPQMQRLIVGFRGRDRNTQSGGSDFRNFGAIDIYGEDPEPEPSFSYGLINRGQVKQTAFLLGYQGRLPHVGRVNLGLQRARYRASFIAGATGAVTTSRDDAWLYNASFALHLAHRLELFGGTQKGLEDSGAAPDNAANRAEQLPTTRSTQYEAGLRWRFGKSQLVASLFQITRPYFSFDGTNRFVALGDARYRGAEISLAGHFDRLTVLAGAVAMKPEVNGPGRTAGLVGERPAGTPSLFARADLQYRTDLPSQFTPTLTVVHTGRRAMGSVPVASLGGEQAILKPYTTFDIGFRQRFQLGDTPVSLRAQWQNVFDTRAWKVVASNTLQPEETQRFSFTLTADF